jgi:nicotinamidase-related amidase
VPHPKETAIVLVGFQNDYFAKDGILRGVVETPGAVDDVLDATLHMIRALKDTEVTIISTPIVLSSDYRAMAAPVGILNTMKEVGAFKEGSKGAETIPELAEFGNRIQYVHGKVGFNAFASTDLDAVLRERGITQVAVCGMVTSLCIDSTGRAAYERGFSVSIISDCSSARTGIEHEFFCANVFPLYGRTVTSLELIDELHAPAGV